ncbi:hypothetical protein [Pseudomonas palleroniana]|uniref:hypothetical protein n=1 Tax=Pseudomonas palleroniana TaxID=191390 RepID=UPI0018E68FC6|nr:hypothetical protein [Pseudomonas palleroniana]MBI6909315.1 hypothetical protein [Pseudomonas palleroniana]
MKTAYINEPGIKPWEGTYPINDLAFTTVTLISPDFSNTWKVWCTITETLSNHWRTKREWRSIGGAEFNSKTEEYLLKKNLSLELNNDALLKKNKTSNVYSIVKNLPSNPQKIDNRALEGSQDVFIALQKTRTETSDFWTSMTVFESSITSIKIKIFLNENKATILSRFYDNETHVAAQFYLSSEHTNEIASALEKAKIKKIIPEEVFYHINSQTSPQKK